MSWPPPDNTPYLPSNGTEGMIFMAEWCEQCARDSHNSDEGPWCEIISNSFIGNVPEWIYRDGKPVCKMFTREDGDGPLEPPDPRQQKLFEEEPKDNG